MLFLVSASKLHPQSPSETILFVAYVYPTCAVRVTTLVLVVNSDWFQVLWSYTLLLQLPVLPLMEGQLGLLELSVISCVTGVRY